MKFNLELKYFYFFFKSHAILLGCITKIYFL